jgi:small subunit ribosomal protein S29
MPSSTCLRSFALLSLDAAAPRTLIPRAACFSTSAARYANPQMKKKNMTAAPKKGVKSLNTKKGKKAPGGENQKRPAQGERKALRKRIVLSNNNALEVSSLKDFDKDNVLSEQNQGRVMGLPEHVVDALRAVDAFKTNQGWSFFRRPAVLVRKETVQLAKLFKEAEASATGETKKTLRRILSGERMGGKSTLLLQGLAMGYLRDWFVINLPEGKHVRIGAGNSANILQPRSSSTLTPTTRLSRSRSLSSILRISTLRTSSSRYSNPTDLFSCRRNCPHSMTCPLRCLPKPR